MQALPSWTGRVGLNRNNWKSFNYSVTYRDSFLAEDITVPQMRYDDFSNIIELLSGPIPNELSKLKNLTGLDLSLNQLTGFLPPALSNLSRLVRLLLKGNDELEQTLPPILAAPPTVLLSSDSASELLASSEQAGSSGSQAAYQAGTSSTAAGGSSTFQPMPQFQPVPQPQPVPSHYEPTDADTVIKAVPLWAQRVGMTSRNWRNFCTKIQYYDDYYNENVLVSQLSFNQFERITELRLINVGLVGTISHAFSELTHLRVLNLRQNQLEGWLPDSISNLINLEGLDLSKNRLSGIVPESLGSMYKLVRLNLEDNQFSGSLPQSLDRLVNLKYLLLRGNPLLNIQLPPRLATLPTLQLSRAVNTAIQFSGARSNSPSLSIRSAENRLTGSLPESLGRLTRLVRLLSGGIIPEIGSLSKLVRLNLENNQLSGDIPIQLDGLVALKYLLLRGNPRLSRDLPPFLGNESRKLRYTHD
eukprot:jgi/Hompol1/896/HPOL_005452-RA